MIIEKAHQNDYQILTEITKKSKAYWGYSDEQIQNWSQYLTITQTYIVANSVYKLTVNNKIIGYYSFFSEEEQKVKLDNLFLLPEYIGQGFGRILMNDFLKNIKNTNTKSIIVHSEPNAEAFYTKLGFVKVGQIETSIKDRFMPVMELSV